MSTNVAATPSPSDRALRGSVPKSTKKYKPFNLDSRQVPDTIRGSDKVVLVDKALDLEPPPADAVRFVPVNLCPPDALVRKPDGRFALELSPAPLAILCFQVLELANTPADGDHPELFDFANELEEHFQPILVNST